MGRVEGKVALITGAGSGLGRASAIHLAEEGAYVIATDLNQISAAATEKEINNNYPGKAISARHDATNKNHWKQVLNLAQTTFGSLNILVNNAGISIGGDIETTEFSDWKKLQEIDVDSVFWGCKLAIRSFGLLCFKIFSLYSLPAILTIWASDIPYFLNFSSTQVSPSLLVGR